MDDRELDELVAAAAPMGDGEVAALALDGSVADLREAVMSTPPVTPRAGAAPATTSSHGPPAAAGTAGEPDGAADGAEGRPVRRARRLARRRRVVLAGAAALVALVLVATGVLGSGQGDVVTVDEPSASPTETPAPAPGPTQAVEPSLLAEGPPRLLVTAEGWAVTRAEEHQVGQGEMTFTGPGESLVVDLRWWTGDAGGAFDEENTAGMERLPDATIAGRPAELFTEPPVEGQAVDEGAGEERRPGDAQAFGDEQAFFVARWTDREYGLELWGNLPDGAAFEQVVTSVQAVDAATWLAALPDSVVRPGTVAATVQAMLADVPVPPGLDPSSLGTEDGRVRDRYQLGANVTGAVACAWIGQWADATARRDTAAAQQAVDAMATSPDWDILRELASQGGWSGAVWELAAAIGGEGTVDRGRPDMLVADVYSEELGCNDG